MKPGLTPKPRYSVALIRGEADMSVPKKAPHRPQFCHTAPLRDTSNCISCRNT
jgi:hypothetical protein